MPDLDLSFPQIDTREMLRSISNYVPIFSALIDVVGDKTKIDGMLAKALEGDVVRYSGVKTTITTVKPEKQKRTHLFGFRIAQDDSPEQEVNRNEVEGLLWFRAGEAGADISKGQICNIEFDSSFHNHLDHLQENSKLSEILKNPEVPILLIKGLVVKAGEAEINILADILKSEERLDWNADERNFSWLTAQVLACKRVPEGEGVHIASVSGYDVFLKRDNGYNLLEVDATELQSRFGDSYTGFLDLHLLSKREQQAQALLGIEPGEGIILDSDVIFSIPNEGAELLVGGKPQKAGAVEVEKYKEHANAITNLLSRPELKCVAQDALDLLLAHPEGYAIAEGVTLLLSQPVKNRSVLENKVTAKANTSQETVPWLRFRTALNLAESAYTICRSDAGAVGVTIKNSNSASDREYLKWTPNGFIINKALDMQKPKPADWQQHSATDVFRQYRKFVGSYVGLPMFIHDAGGKTVSDLMNILVDNPPGKAFPLRGKWSQVATMNEGSRVLIGNAKLADNRIYAIRNKQGEFGIIYGDGQPYPRDEKILSQGISDMHIVVSQGKGLTPTEAGKLLEDALSSGMDLEAAFEKVRGASKRFRFHRHY